MRAFQGAKKAGPFPALPHFLDPYPFSNIPLRIKKNFREDFFFRLFSVAIRLPSLSERKEDIVPLSMAFLEDTCNLFNEKVAGFSLDILNLFNNYQWLGNVRFYALLFVSSCRFKRNYPVTKKDPIV